MVGTWPEASIPYTAVATDLLCAEEVWFQRGPLVSAIRASIALPGAITPVAHSDRLLADGELTNPILVAATAAVAADVTIAVSLAEARHVDRRELARTSAPSPRPKQQAPTDNGGRSTRRAAT